MYSTRWQWKPVVKNMGFGVKYTMLSEQLNSIPEDEYSQVNLSKPHFPYSQNGEPNSTHFARLLWGLVRWYI